MRLAPARAAITVCALFFLSSCISEGNKGLSDIFGSSVSLRDLDGVLLEPDADTDQWDYPDIDLGEGTISRVIWLGSGEAEPLAKVIANLPPVLDKRVTVTPGIKFPNQNRFDDNGKYQGVGAINLEAISLTGPFEDVDLVTEVIVGIQKSIPQIEVGIRVVEVLENDSFAFGIDYAFKSVENTSGPTKSIFNNASSVLGLPEIPGRTALSNSLDLPLLIDLGTVSNGVQMDFLIRALQLFARTDLLNAPHVRVLDGYSAQITAGQEIPFFTPNFNSNGLSNVSTQFKEVGIKLYITPKVVGRDLVRINLTTAVEAVTGESTFESDNFSVTNPIITTRRASTLMDVYDGDTAIIGGLLQRSQIQNENSIPVLGDIPVLGVFFSSKSKQVIQSNLIFFISPRIIDASREIGRMITPAPLPEADPNDAGN